MGRAKNMIIDKHHEFEEDLGSLRKQLADKSTPFTQEELESLVKQSWAKHQTEQ